MLAITYRTSDTFMHGLETSREKKKNKKNTKKEKKEREWLAAGLSSPSPFLSLRMHLCPVNVCMSHMRAGREGLTLDECILSLVTENMGQESLTRLTTCWQTWIGVSIPAGWLCMEKWLTGQSPRKTQICHIFLTSGIVTSWVKWFSHQKGGIYLPAAGLQRDWSSERGSVSSTQS